MRAETAITVTHATLRDASLVISWLIEKALTAIVTAEGHNGDKRADH